MPFQDKSHLHFESNLIGLFRFVQFILLAAWGDCNSYLAYQVAKRECKDGLLEQHLDALGRCFARESSSIVSTANTASAD